MPFRLPLLALLAVLFTGCTTVPGPPSENDPWESYNRSIYKFNDAFDKTVLRPVAKDYRDYMPEAAKTGFHNFFSNLNDVTVFTNSLLQFKFEQAATDISRIVWNTTVGLLGFIDVASYMGLAKHNEDFGQTLGKWGAPPGPYFVIPFLGPRTVRGTVAIPVNIATSPLYYNLITDERVNLGLLVLDGIDKRAGFVGVDRIIDESAIDPYIFVRDSYLQQRQNLVNDGRTNNDIPPDIGFEPASGEDLELELELERELEQDRPVETSQ